MDDEYFFWDDDKKLAFVQARLGQMVAATGGSLFTDEQAETVELRVRCGSHPARMVVDYDSGWVKFQLQFQNATGLLTLHWDPESSEKPVDADPDWGGKDAEVRHFLSPGLYIEEYTHEANAMAALARRVPPPLAQRVLAVVQAENAGQLEIAADRIDVRMRRDFHELPDPLSTASNVLALMVELAAFFGARVV